MCCTHQDCAYSNSTFVDNCELSRFGFMPREGFSDCQIYRDIKNAEESYEKKREEDHRMNEAKIHRIPERSSGILGREIPAVRSVEESSDLPGVSYKASSQRVNIISGIRLATKDKDREIKFIMIKERKK